MLIGVLTFGSIAALITVAALLSRKPAAPPVRTSPIASDPDDPAKKVIVPPPSDEATGGRDRIGDTLDKLKEIAGGLLSGVTEPDQPDKPGEPEPIPGPDPYAPSPSPRPGDYYQVIKGDTLWEIARAAYGNGALYPRIVSDDLNRWIAADPGKGWGGGLYARYSGWNTKWMSGTKYPVVFVPVI